ncbi:hypothetical protein F0562_010038 [Nyssa sinensis]|uniref:DM2 domain-containing protein n=1 Tax=Nyssa sinensis TaxID=561372 RepID=A0A5J4ZXR7_9ASTE|nr:hypothetical protein F0562_010038 [Nyssa sinensis]
MSVRPKELTPGSQLIMGLNPPFGVNAALANKFINKALEFKPKLLILIVPPETEREGHENHGPGKNQSEGTPKKRKRGKGKHGRGSGVISQVDTQNAERHSPAKMTGSKSLDRHPSEHFETPSTDVGIEGYWHFGHSNAGSQAPFPTGYGGTWGDDITMRYGLNTEEPYASIPQRWSRGTSPVPDVPRASMDGRGYRTYMSEMDERYGRETNIQQPVRLYGQQDPNSLAQRNNYIAGQNPGFSSPYGRVGYRPDSMGYAPGPCNTLSQRNSSGWLND